MTILFSDLQKFKIRFYRNDCIGRFEITVVIFFTTANGAANHRSDQRVGREPGMLRRNDGKKSIYESDFGCTEEFLGGRIMYLTSEGEI